MKQRKTTRKYNLIFYKELTMGFLAIISSLLVIYELTLHPSLAVIREIADIDILIATVFFIEYIYLLHHAKKKIHFMIHNWYLLLASIPIVDSWAEILKAFRIFKVFRVMRAQEHINFSWREIKRDAPKRHSKTN